MAGLLTASIPFAAVGILAFTWYIFDRKQGIFAVATLSSLIAFLILTAMLAGIAVVKGPAEILAQGARYNGMAWVIMFTYFLAEYRYRIRELGTILMPVALALMIISIFDTHSSAGPYQFDSVPVLVHLAFVFMGLAMVFLAFAGGVLYLLRTRALRDPSHESLASKLPALATLDRVMTSAFTAGFPLFTVGLILGILYAGSTLQAGWWQNPKIIAGICNWLVYAVLTYFYHRQVLMHRRLAQAIIGLFVVSVAAYALSSSFSPKLEVPPPAVIEAVR